MHIHNMLATFAWYVKPFVDYSCTNKYNDVQEILASHPKLIHILYFYNLQERFIIIYFLKKTLTFKYVWDYYY